MERIVNKETIEYLGKKVKVSGWVNSIRSHGKIVFIDLRDRSGLVQLVCKPETTEQIRPEWVIEIEGKVTQRPQKMINPKIETGKVEILVESLKILSKAKTLPFSIDSDGYEINEEKRMKYRYLDLRRERMKKNLIVRQKVIQFMRDFLQKEGFIEVETPILTKSTPEGARDFIVPSRLQPGKFYALPQSPQQYKQLLMVSGIEKYFQIARCLRDEDPRADRQAEHTQLDIEMSFIKQADVMEIIERLFIELIRKLYPEKKIQKIPFPRITYQRAMERYNSDRPDLRNNKTNSDLLAFCWVIDFPFFEKDEKEGWAFTHNPFSAPKSKFMEDLLHKRNIENILTTQYDIVLNGFEIGGGSIRNHQSEALEAVFEIIGYKKEEIKEKFGHMLKAFEYGAPPHGGIASGIDRFLAILQNEPSIREIIAFPKTGDSRDLMMDAPSEVSEKQLKELKIKISKKTKK
ncbi:MAG: aspartate--tRNA ligase [Candidatus Nealsonbacteria bacterium CG10_big_fil_rev_8_21_14_0_10_36_24]|uniref:Aspartate--tRNA(Asp/Asn) ligase n=2 Tax=Candidatus Nealsoniibacteriota TaxID=1817911 RepID=A0A2M6NSJ9_9BACT|nr:MAG: aspartate--tRNA ligase [Candidatus Nealsonbacteria bacterium CG10_big_fil_rev_8_21_14_0_10_36_24]